MFFISPKNGIIGLIVRIRIFALVKNIIPDDNIQFRKYIFSTKFLI